jgi:acyl-coenzyme A synthetase/AMP-(fatty) acid ligase
MSVYEIFLPLSNGATIVMAESDEMTDGSALIELIQKNNITLLQATPSLWNILLASGWTGKKDLKGIVGGEALSSNLVRQIIPKVGEFWNFYGPTETTVYATGIQIMDTESPILIGKPIDNTSIFILDKDNKRMPLGTIGEVCIGGIGVAQGYLNRPDLSSEKFIRFYNNQIIYKTGDWGKFHSDGSIELFGRIDNQIKLRGFRIEPGEIETLLNQVNGIKESVVKIQKFDNNDDRLIAFLNVTNEHKLTDQEIIEKLKRKLPPYMIPSFFQRSDSFPRMPNGKINRKALQFNIDFFDNQSRIDFDSLSETEIQLLKIWEELLKTKNFTIFDNFFNIGGNSLLALSIISKIKSYFNVEFNFRFFVQSPRIKDLAEVVEILKNDNLKIPPSIQKEDYFSRTLNGEV